MNLAVLKFFLLLSRTGTYSLFWEFNRWLAVPQHHWKFPDTSAQALEQLHIDRDCSKESKKRPNVASDSEISLSHEESIDAWPSSSPCPQPVCCPCGGHYRAQARSPLIPLRRRKVPGCKACWGSQIRDLRKGSDSMTGSHISRELKW